MDSSLFPLFVAACLFGIIAIGLLVDYIRKTGFFEKRNQHANHTNELLVEIYTTFTTFESDLKQIETNNSTLTEQTLATSRKIEELMKEFGEMVGEGYYEIK